MAEKKDIRPAGEAPADQAEQAAAEIAANVAQETAPAAGNMSEEPIPKKKTPPKKKKHIIRNVIIIVIVAAIAALVIFGCVKFFGGSGSDGEIVTAVVSSGSITSTVSGEGLTRAKDSASLTLTTSGTVEEGYVKEGDTVEAGQQLYKIRSEAAEKAVTDAQKAVEDSAKELQKLREAQANLTVRAPYKGKIQLDKDASVPKVGDDMSSGTKLATLVDDSKMKLVQYYSYAYAKQIKAGQKATISIPSSMSTVSGTVSEVHMVDRISAEGSRLFEVDLVMNNPGTLTAGVDASATLSVGSETIYPYEAGKLQYNQSTDIVTKVSGPVQKVNLRNYAEVAAGEVLLVMSGDDSDTDIYNANENLQSKQKALEEAQKVLDVLNGVAPISGTVMSVSIAPGDEVESSTTAVVVSDNSTILLDANVDERNISYVKEGMSVDIDQWGTAVTGVVSSVSLTSKAENGVATFPAVISIDNSDGSVLPGSYATYTMVASQSDNCLLLPIQAVKSVETMDGTQTVVFVHSPDRPDNAVDLDTPVDGVPDKDYWAVPVEIGISDNQNVEILSGVEEGTEVFQQVAYSDSMY